MTIKKWQHETNRRQDTSMNIVTEGKKANQWIEVSGGDTILVLTYYRHRGFLVLGYTIPSTFYLNINY